VDPAREVLQFGHRVGQSRRDAGQLSSQVAPVGGTIGQRGARRQCERDQALLGTVVQITLDPAASLSDAATIRLREAASSDLLSAFAMAVASSSVNFSRRPSVPAGRSSSVDETVIAPHRRPSTKTGLPTVETVPRRRAATATAPLADDQSVASTRAERPVR
jgi:hypothetical protein